MDTSLRTEKPGTWESYRENALAEIADLSPYHLACSQWADCGSPDSNGSEGSIFLLSVRDNTVEWLESVDIDTWHAAAMGDDVQSLDDDGSMHQIADDAPDVYTSTRWAEFIDLSAYQEELSELGEVDPDDLTRSVAGVALYLIARRLVESLTEAVATSYREAIEDAEAEATERDDAGRPL